MDKTIIFLVAAIVGGANLYWTRANRTAINCIAEVAYYVCLALVLAFAPQAAAHLGADTPVTRVVYAFVVLIIPFWFATRSLNRWKARLDSEAHARAKAAWNKNLRKS